MFTYRLKEKCGRHVTEDRKLVLAGETFATRYCLDKHPDKFELIEESAKKEEAPDENEHGEDVTLLFAVDLRANDVGASVFKKGRRYRIVVDETVVNTTPSRLTNEAKVREALAAMNQFLEDEDETDEEA